MRKILILILISLVTQHAFSAIKTVTGNSGQGWGTAANWLPTGVPQDGDQVIIPLGFTISVKGTFYTAAENLSISILGVLDFDPSGKLDLGNRSSVQLFNAIASITSNGTGSEVINIGGVTKYRGQSDGTLKGALFATAATSSSPNGFFIGVLPVELTRFTAAKENGTILLQWTTATEDRTHHFQLERSADAVNWKPLTILEARGNTSKYAYQDESPLTGSNFYRLKIVALDASASYSAMVQLNPNKTALFSIGPNPARSFINILMPYINTDLRIQILNTSGKVVKEQSLKASNSNYKQLDVSQLPKGHYYLLVRNREGVLNTEAFQVR